MAQTTSTQIPADEENFPGGFDNDETYLVHFMKEECKTFDLLQDPEQLGAPFLDDEFDIRSYTPMSKLIKDPAWREMYLEVAQSEDQSPHFPVPLNVYHEEGAERIKSIPWEPAPGDSNPKIKELAEKGRHGDSVMVLMPMNMVYLLGLSKGGEVDINPMTGYPEFGGWNVGNIFKSVVRVGATVAGAMLGGPAGAAAGNAIGGALTGRKTRDLLPTALKAAAYTAAANTGMNMYQGQGAMQAMGNSMGPSNLGSMNPFSQAAAPLAQNAAAAAGPGAGQAASTVAPAASPGASALPSTTGQGGWLPSLMQAAPYALMAGSGLLAKKGDQENWENKRKADEENYRRQEENDEKWRHKTGFYDSLNTKIAKKMPNPAYGQPGEPYYIYEGDTAYRAHRAEGGDVKKDDANQKPKGEKILEKDTVKSGVILKGPGDGTSDSIHTDVLEDTYIMPAIMVANLGNGDSAAGARMVKQELEDLERKFGKERFAKLVELYSHNTKVPVALSVGEIPIDPAHVALIGDGSLPKGLRRLDHAAKEVKKHKSSYKGKIPPNAKAFAHYLGD